MPSPAEAAPVEIAARESYARIVATLIRLTGDWDLAEDCAQEALALAVERWPSAGVPGNPGGWLMTVARNRAIDVLRRQQTEQRKLALLAAEPAPPEADEEEIVDDRLRLMFTCCHPALPLEARVALTLRTIAGVPTADIARAFLVTEATMTRRLTRAKAKIAQAGIPYRVPSGPMLTERLPGVLAVVYLLFTQGYNVDGEPAFADEAIRLARLLRRLMPEQPEVAGLLALFLFQHSRRDARRDADGNLLTLDRQDRSRWDHAAITEAAELLAAVPENGPYVLQARIASGHAGDESDWPAIARWYDDLAELQPTPVIRLNRAVAHGYAYGPDTGLRLLAEARTGGALDGYPLAVAAEAELTARHGDRLRAELLFREAADLAGSPAERKALLERAAQMSKTARPLRRSGMTEYLDSIAYDRRGDGPVVILIGGAAQFRAVDPATRELTDLLGDRGFTVIHYDRPGRGDSGDAPPYTLAGDVAAVRRLIAAHGGRATLYGSSSGGAIALAVAAEEPGVERLLLWEVPLGDSGSADFVTELRGVIADSDPEKILACFMADMPPEWLRGMRDSSDWPLYARMAPTVQADAEALAWTPRWTDITAPAHVLVSRDAPDFFHATADSIVAHLAHAEKVEAPGSGHRWEAREMADTLEILLRRTVS